jgi:hypothetical protein
MTGIEQLRTAITGLVSFAAAAEELMLCIPAAAAEQGGPDCWAAVPLIAHNTEFKRQQVTRLEAIGRGETPPTFTEIDHRSADTYRGYSRQSAGEVLQASRAATAALIDGLGVTPDEDLLDPSRNPWLRGRQLWLQTIVRGFWHPMGHIGGYYICHGQPARAAACQAQAVAMASYLDAPDPARGMAYYNLACAQARSQPSDGALGSLRQAVELNPDLRANIGRDDDLAVLRASGQLDTLLGS